MDEDFGFFGDPDLTDGNDEPYMEAEDAFLDSEWEDRISGLYEE